MGYYVSVKLYLSSYRLGNFSEELIKLVGKSQARVAVISNAVDWSTDTRRIEDGIKKEFEDMQSLGFMPSLLDLRDYFGKPGLTEYLSKFDMVWVRGGNAFILVKAMKLSGFDDVIEKLIKPGKLVYAGYSAAFCAVSPSLKGVELVDDANAKAEGYKDFDVWEGYGLVDFYPIVHFRSDHPESDSVEKEYEYVKARNSKFKTFADGDVYIRDGASEKVLS